MWFIRLLTPEYPAHKCFFYRESVYIVEERWRGETCWSVWVGSSCVMSFSLWTTPNTAGLGSSPGCLGGHRIYVLALMHDVVHNARIHAKTAHGLRATGEIPLNLLAARNTCLLVASHT